MFQLTQQPYLIAEGLPPAQRRDFYRGVAAFPLKYFCPNGAQERVINAIQEASGESRIPVILYTFANGVGKTTITVQIVGNIADGPQNGWFDLPVFNDWPYPRKVWYCSTAEAIKNTVIPEFEKIFQNGVWESGGEYTETKEGRPYVSKLVIKGAARTIEIAFKTYDQAASTYESDTVGLIIADEPMPEDLWKAVKSRRRMGALTLMPMTPLYCPPYIFDELAKEKPGHRHLEADVYQACKKRGIRGHLDPETIDAMVDDYDDDEREARAYGKPMFFSGRIYAGLDKERHFVSPDRYPITKGSYIVMATDPHESRPCAVTWWAHDPNGRWICFAESPSDQSRKFWDMRRSKTFAAEIAEWQQIEAQWMERITKGLSWEPWIDRILDKRFGWQTRGETTLADIFSREGQKLGFPLYYRESYTSNNPEGELTVGHKLVRESIRQTLPDGGPGLVIYDHCKHTWDGLTHYMRERITGKAADRKPGADGLILEKYKDFPDAVRYAIGTMMDAVPPQREKGWHEKWVDELEEEPEEGVSVWG